MDDEPTIRTLPRSEGVAASGGNGIEEVEHGVDERERFGCREVVGVAQRHVAGVGERVDERVGGLGEVVIAEGHEHRAGDATDVGRRDRPGVRPAQHGRERDRVVALDPRVLAEQTGEVVVFIRLGRRPRLPARMRAVAASSRSKTLRPIPASTRRWNRSGAAIAVRSSVSAPSENPTASTGPVWQRLDDPGGQVGVRRRLVRLRRGAVTQQVDADHVAAGIGQQGGETAALPRGRERSTPAVHEDHGDRHGPQRRAARRCS